MLTRIMFRLLLILAVIILAVQIQYWDLEFLGEYRDYLLSFIIAFVLQPVVMEHLDL